MLLDNLKKKFAVFLVFQIYMILMLSAEGLAATASSVAAQSTWQLQAVSSTAITDKFVFNKSLGDLAVGSYLDQRTKIVPVVVNLVTEEVSSLLYALPQTVESATVLDVNSTGSVYLVWGSSSQVSKYSGNERAGKFYLVSNGGLKATAIPRGEGVIARAIHEVGGKVYVVGGDGPVGWTVSSKPDMSGFVRCEPKSCQVFPGFSAWIGLFELSGGKIARYGTASGRAAISFTEESGGDTLYIAGESPGIVLDVFSKADGTYAAAGASGGNLVRRGDRAFYRSPQGSVIISSRFPSSIWKTIIGSLDEVFVVTDRGQTFLWKTRQNTVTAVSNTEQGVSTAGTVIDIVQPGSESDRSNLLVRIKPSGISSSPYAKFSYKPMMTSPRAVSTGIRRTAVSR